MGLVHFCCWDDSVGVVVAELDNRDHLKGPSRDTSESM